jgi:hypothetical protein
MHILRFKENIAIAKAARQEVILSKKLLAISIKSQSSLRWYEVVI